MFFIAELHQIVSDYIVRELVKISSPPKSKRCYLLKDIHISQRTIVISAPESCSATTGWGGLTCPNVRPSRITHTENMLVTMETTCFQSKTPQFIMTQCFWNTGWHMEPAFIGKLFFSLYMYDICGYCLTYILFNFIIPFN